MLFQGLYKGHRDGKKCFVIELLNNKRLIRYAIIYLTENCIFALYDTKITILKRYNDTDLFINKKSKLKQLNKTKMEISFDELPNNKMTLEIKDDEYVLSFATDQFTSVVKTIDNK